MSLDLSLKRYVTNNKNDTTHTKIGSTDLNVFGNKYHILQENEKKFYEDYKRHVFEKKEDAYLTEKQLLVGKIAIDLDFRYDINVQSKQHSDDHIADFIELLSTQMNGLFSNIENQTIRFHIFEKPNVNKCENKTKDGIHIIINILCDFATKMVLRDLLLQEIEDVWGDLPITNTWSDVIDEGVMKGFVNWQLYGSKKPGCESYQLKYIYDMTIANGEMDLQCMNVEKEPFDFEALVVRSTKNCHSFTIAQEYEVHYETKKRECSHKKNNKTLKRKTNVSTLSLQECRNFQEVEELVKSIIDDDDTDYNYKEMYQYVMSLPKEFWGPGSFTKWIRVGWALKNTSKKDTEGHLLYIWYLFCSQSPDFDFQHNDVLEYWEQFDILNNEGLSFKSIIYWCKKYNYEEFKNIYKQTIDHCISYSFRNNGDYDLANTLYNMFKSQYVCVGIDKNAWYQYINNKWVWVDSATTLRLRISTEMYKKYEQKLIQFQTTNQAKQNNIALSTNVNPNQNTIVSSSGGQGNQDEFADFKKQVNDMLATCKLLKKTPTKNNIMREAKDLFYDGEFLNNLDKDNYLLGCNNCVIDFREKTHRKGKHDDYISKSTGIVYLPLEEYRKKQPHLIAEIEEFMAQLFPETIQYDEKDSTKEISRDSSLRSYMWDHLASTLLGTIENQTFNIYNGSGANGKSKLVELMSLVLGEYKSTVPLSLITQKRTNIGGTSSEVYNLMGTRYAVMQEPSKNDKINEGIMKELTGGDPIQCRALFKDSVTFIPQFKLVVCANHLFDVVSNDDGTWRRLRKVDFNSKFTDDPYNDPNFPVKDYPYQYKVDTKIDEKFKVWAPVLLSMLVDIAYRTQGKVRDVKPVMSATDDYRKDQDVILAFHNATFVASDNEHKSNVGIKEREITQKFSKYLDEDHADMMNKPKPKEVKDFFIKKYGKFPKGGWTNFVYKTDDFENKSHFQ